MKNIHVLRTDKPTGIFKSGNNLLFSITNKVRTNPEGFHIYITSDEEIKEGDRDFYIIANDRDKTWINRLEKVIECKIDPYHGKVLVLSFGFLWVDEGKKIILTTDADLIKDGVQAIDDEFLQWFVKNPSCERVEIEKGYIGVDLFNYKIIIPTEKPKQIYYNTVGMENGINVIKGQFTTQREALDLANKLNRKFPYLYYDWRETLVKHEIPNEPKQETLEEATIVAVRLSEHLDAKEQAMFVAGFEECIKWQHSQSRGLYNEEDLRKAYIVGKHGGSTQTYYDFDEWFNQFKNKTQ